MLIKYPNICLAIFKNNYKYTIILYIPCSLSLHIKFPFLLIN